MSNHGSDKRVLPDIVSDIYGIKSIYKHISSKMWGYSSFFQKKNPKMTRQLEFAIKRKLRVESVDCIQMFSYKRTMFRGASNNFFLKVRKIICLVLWCRKTPAKIKQHNMSSRKCGDGGGEEKHVHKCWFIARRLKGYLFECFTDLFVCPYTDGITKSGGSITGLSLCQSDGIYGVINLAANLSNGLEALKGVVTSVNQVSLWGGLRGNEV